MHAEQRQVELWPYLLAGVCILIAVVLVAGLAVYAARKSGRIVATLYVIGFALFALALLTLGYTFVTGPPLLLAVVVTPLFAGATAAMAFYRRFTGGRAQGHGDHGALSGVGGASAGTRPAAGPWFAPVWLLASMVGSAAAGVGLLLSFFGQLVLFGALVGGVQALTLFRYLHGAGVWVLASFLGWVCGSVVAALFASTGFLSAGGWVGLALAQGLALLMTAFSAPGRRLRLRRPVLAWFPVAIVGGVLAGVLGSLVGTRLNPDSILPGEPQGGLWYELAPTLAGATVAGAVYGIVTAPVLVWLLHTLAWTLQAGNEDSDAST